MEHPTRRKDKVKLECKLISHGRKQRNGGDDKIVVPHCIHDNWMVLINGSG